MRLTISLLSLSAAVLGLAWWVNSGEPPFVPYEAWNVSHDSIFPLEKSYQDPAPARLRNEDLLNAEEFAFTMGVGSGMHGLDVFRVDASGNAFYVFSTGDGNWWKAEFKVAAPVLAKLRRLLVDVDYASLERAYHAAVCDGTQWCIRVDVAGATKKVYCDNYFPEAAERLASMISREVLPAHEAKIKNARRIWQSTARSAAAGLWRGDEEVR